MTLGAVQLSRELRVIFMSAVLSVYRGRCKVNALQVPKCVGQLSAMVNLAGTETVLSTTCTVRPNRRRGSAVLWIVALCVRA